MYRRHVELNPAPADLEDFARRYTAAWCSQDAASVAAFFSPNGSLSVNGRPAVGRPAITAVAQEFMTAFPDLLLLLDGVHPESGGNVYSWTFIGTHTGPDGTGRRVRFSGREVWRFGADGLITTSLGTFDQADYRRQLDGLP